MLFCLTQIIQNNQKILKEEKKSATSHIYEGGIMHV